MGYGYKTSNLFHVLWFIIIGWMVKLNNSFRIVDSLGVRSMSFILISIDDFLFSVDRFFSPLVIQKRWDLYLEMNHFEISYFYIHRIIGSLALVIGIFSIAGVF